MARRLLFSRWFIHVNDCLMGKVLCLGLFPCGHSGADTLMTLVIFSAAVSAANSAIYASSRMLWSMAGDHFAPARFSRVSRNGVPVNAILLTAVLALVSMLTRYISAQQLYLYLIASTGQVGCLARIVIGWCQYRFRRAVDRGEYPSSLLRYRSLCFRGWRQL